MSAEQYYRTIWRIEHADDVRGDWPIRMAEAYASQQCASLRDEIERLHIALCQAASLMNQGEHFDAYKIVREALAASPKGDKS